MARGINKVILIGNLGADPEVRSTASGTQITSIRLATSDSWTDKQGQRQERTEWHRVVFFSRLAEVASQYLRKGSKVYIEGSLRTQQWEKNGEKRYSTEIHANEMQMLDGRAGGGQESYGGDYGEGPPMSPRQSSGGGSRANADADMGGRFDDFDDDIPF
ncbi:MAG: single-stranded DNA-binding protein [Pseudomonadales bacterium]|nr:single-stranded DNA-binding protein [Pseudomonadales bacterium]